MNDTSEDAMPKGSHGEVLVITRSVSQVILEVDAVPASLPMTTGRPWVYKMIWRQTKQDI